MSTDRWRKIDFAKLVETLSTLSMRKAAGLKYSTTQIPPSIKNAASSITDRVADKLRHDDDGIIRCKVCGRGPFTRRGFHLHLQRVHIDVVYNLVREELEYYIWRVRNIPSYGKEQTREE